MASALSVRDQNNRWSSSGSSSRWLPVRPRRKNRWSVRCSCSKEGSVAPGAAAIVGCSFCDDAGDGRRRCSGEVFVAQQDAVGCRGGKPAQHAAPPAAGADEVSVEDLGSEFAFVTTGVVFARLTSPGDQGVAAVADQADGAVVVMDVGVALAVGLDEVRLGCRAQLIERCRAFGGTDQVRAEPGGDAVDVVDRRGADAVQLVQDDP